MPVDPGSGLHVVAALQANAAVGDRAILLLPSGPDYFAAFFACLYAGVIAVPAYPPESSRHHHQERLLSILSDAEPRVLLTSSHLRESLLALPELTCADTPAAPECAQYEKLLTRAELAFKNVPICALTTRT